MDDELKQHLERNSYTDLRMLPSGELAGLFRFIFTCGLVVGLNRHSFRTRYCYHTVEEARAALEVWDGCGDAPGNWIKQKPEDRLNPNRGSGE